MDYDSAMKQVLEEERLYRELEAEKWRRRGRAIAATYNGAAKAASGIYNGVSAIVKPTYNHAIVPTAKHVVAPLVKELYSDGKSALKWTIGGFFRNLKGATLGTLNFAGKCATNYANATAYRQIKQDYKNERIREGETSTQKESGLPLWAAILGGDKRMESLEKAAGNEDVSEYYAHRENARKKEESDKKKEKEKKKTAEEFEELNEELGELFERVENGRIDENGKRYYNTKVREHKKLGKKLGVRSPNAFYPSIREAEPFSEDELGAYENGFEPTEDGVNQYKAAEQRKKSEQERARAPEPSRRAPSRNPAPRRSADPQPESDENEDGSYSGASREPTQPRERKQTGRKTLDIILRPFTATRNYFVSKEKSEDREDKKLAKVKDRIKKYGGGKIKLDLAKDYTRADFRKYQRSLADRVRLNNQTPPLEGPYSTEQEQTHPNQELINLSDEQLYEAIKFILEGNDRNTGAEEIINSLQKEEIVSMLNDLSREDRQRVAQHIFGSHSESTRPQNLEELAEDSRNRIPTHTRQPEPYETQTENSGSEYSTTETSQSEEPATARESSEQDLRTDLNQIFEEHARRRVLSQEEVDASIHDYDTPSSAELSDENNLDLSDIRRPEAPITRTEMPSEDYDAATQESTSEIIAEPQRDYTNGNLWEEHLNEKNETQLHENPLTQNQTPIPKISRNYQPKNNRPNRGMNSPSSYHIQVKRHSHR